MVKTKRVIGTPFTSENQPDISTKLGKPRGKYLTALLKKFLEKKINYIDPETQKMIRGSVKDAILWRLICNGTEGDSKAIGEILDRVEGKLKSSDSSVEVNVTVMPTIKKDGKRLEFGVDNRLT